MNFYFNSFDDAFTREILQVKWDAQLFAWVHGTIMRFDKLDEHQDEKIGMIYFILQS